MIAEEEKEVIYKAIKIYRWKQFWPIRKLQDATANHETLTHRMESVSKEVPHNWQNEIPRDELDLCESLTLAPGCQETEGERD
jgi:hypothetical protein